MLFLWKFGLILFGCWHFPMKVRISLSIPTMKMFPDWGCNKSVNQFVEDLKPSLYPPPSSKVDRLLFVPALYPSIIR